MDCYFGLRYSNKRPIVPLFDASHPIFLYNEQWKFKQKRLNKYYSCLIIKYIYPKIETGVRNRDKNRFEEWVNFWLWSNFG